MNHTWLGVFAGFIMLGLWALMGLTIFHGKNLVMYRENWELARILVPSMISVAGWLVTIWWALRQIEISSENNRTLQHEMLQSNEKIKVIDAIIVAYIEIDKALRKIQRSTVNLKNNIDFKVKGKNNPNLPAIFHDSNNTYSDLLERIDYLQFNLIRIAPYGIGVESSFDFIDMVNKEFSNQSTWLAYQEKASEYLLDESSNYETLFATIDAVALNCEKLSSEAYKVVAGINKPNKANSADGKKPRS